MGDRANILFKEEDGGEIYFYTHWDGHKIKNTVINALKRGKSRWADGQYLSRIIFCELIKDDVTGLTGYGISTYCGDGDGDIIIVDVGKQTVTYKNVTKTFSEIS